MGNRTVLPRVPRRPRPPWPEQDVMNQALPWSVLPLAHKEGQPHQTGCWYRRGCTRPLPCVNPSTSNGDPSEQLRRSGNRPKFPISWRNLLEEDGHFCCPDVEKLHQEAVFPVHSRPVVASALLGKRAVALGATLCHPVRSAAASYPRRCKTPSQACERLPSRSLTPR